jgi:hypothetical protein
VRQQDFIAFFVATIKIYALEIVDIEKYRAEIIGISRIAGISGIS